MNVWQPEAGETLLVRKPVTFATGAAPQVRGMRWFRDTERNDIQHELQGWPEGPSFTPRSAGNAVTRRFMRGAAKAAGGAVMATLGAAGGNIATPSSGDSGSDTPDSRADEVDDFPVMWAAPGTVGRTLPWQLDPGRADQKYWRTHLIVTDRRALVVELPYDEKNVEAVDDELLWQIPRAGIDAVELKNYRDGEDFTITFSDGSWCRLSCRSRRQLTRYLARVPELLSLTDLNARQGKTVQDCARESGMPDSVTPVITRNPCGHYNVDILPPNRLTSAFGASETSLVLDEEGCDIDPSDYHPEDF
ncbi:hypothetical protein EV562_10689 [Streptomyces sp. BK208]|uniref:hypothetical protein n=1 Tax=Streptomyces sp. BK208 TaxID=2512150 RepID=UPI001061D233|nr:hypothetical protein [Streptomyces sp. BK208]TDT37314.1 hypothetical protein EV562_10689 [Streptomyces sp. BK208]